MNKLTIFGAPQSSYVRTIRTICGEKNVAHDVQPADLKSDKYKKLHPYAKMPVLEHGDVRLYESAAIAIYIDEAFDGPSLQPKEPAARGLMHQYISAINCYIYNNLIRGYAFKYIFAGEDGPDRAAVEAALPKMSYDLGVLDAAYKNSKWIAGDAPSLADFFMAPLVATVGNFPEGAAAIESLPHLRLAFQAIESRDSYQKALPT